jgi:hypothetical protein
MSDVRSTDPDATAHRIARFRTGWAQASKGQAYTEDTLADLTWMNLGWRLGTMFKETSPELVDELYEWCVRQQAASGTRPT